MCVDQKIRKRIQKEKEKKEKKSVTNNAEQGPTATTKQDKTDFSRLTNCAWLQGCVSYGRVNS